MAGVMLNHRGATSVDRSQLYKFHAPTGTKTWRPVPHHLLMDAIEKEVENRGIKIVKSQLAVQREGTIFFGVLDLKSKNDEDDFSSSLGVRAANNRKMSIQIAVGVRVFVCDNLAFSGDMIALKRKHTAKLDLSVEIRSAIDRYEEQFLVYRNAISRQKKLKLTDDQAKIMIFEVFSKSVMPLKIMHDVTQNYFEPPHEEFSSRTMWSLNNAFTESAKLLPEGRKFVALTRVGKMIEKFAQSLE